MPSDFVKDKELKARLQTCLSFLNIHIRWGCADCVARAYMSLKRIRNNNFEVMAGSTYLLRTNLVGGYRYKNKVLSNTNSTEAERKECYNSHPSRASLFQPETIPQPKPKAEPKPKAKKKTAPKEDK